MRRSVLVLAITGVACSAQQPPLADGSIDAAAPIDGSSIDAPTPIDVTTATTDGGALTAECSYCWMGYGQTCDVPCSSATDVMFDLRLTWSGCGYCCTVGDHDQYWRGCHCESGHAPCVRTVGDCQARMRCRGARASSAATWARRSTRARAAADAPDHGWCARAGGSWRRCGCACRRSSARREAQVADFSARASVARGT